MKRALVLGLSLAALAAPAAAQITVIGDAVEEHAVRPGQTVSGTIRLRNTGGRAEEAKVYLSDYTFSADGRTAYGAPGSLPRSSARWVAFSPSQVRIAPGEEATVGYTVTVPADASLAGSYWTTLMVEGIAAGSAESTVPGARVQVGIRPTVRHAVQLAARIEGTGTPAVSFAATRAFGTAEGKVLELDLANAGDVAYRPEIRVELFHEDGRPAGTFTSKRGLLYPGASLRQRFYLGRLPAGTYQALVVADAGGDEVFGAQYRLKL